MCCTGVLQAEGHLQEAVEDIVNYVKGGFSALQYGNISYLPCYAAAGLLIKLGLFNTHGEVWSSYNTTHCQLVVAVSEQAFDQKY